MKKHDMMQWVRMNDGVSSEIVSEAQSWFTSERTRCVRCIHIPSSPDKPRSRVYSFMWEEAGWLSAEKRQLVMSHHLSLSFSSSLLPYADLKWNVIQRRAMT